MDMYKVHELFQAIVRCKSHWQGSEKNQFILELKELLTQHLPQFGELVEVYTLPNRGNGPPYLTIDMYETVEEIFEIVRQILYDAAYIDTHTAYKFMQMEFANLYTPVAVRRGLV